MRGKLPRTTKSTMKSWPYFFWKCRKTTSVFAVMKNCRDSLTASDVGVISSWIGLAVKVDVGWGRSNRRLSTWRIPDSAITVKSDRVICFRGPSVVIYMTSSWLGQLPAASGMNRENKCCFQLTLRGQLSRMVCGVILHVQRKIVLYLRLSGTWIRCWGLQEIPEG